MAGKVGVALPGFQLHRAVQGLDSVVSGPPEPPGKLKPKLKPTHDLPPTLQCRTWNGRGFADPPPGRDPPSWTSLSSS